MNTLPQTPEWDFIKERLKQIIVKSIDTPRRSKKDAEFILQTIRPELIGNLEDFIYSLLSQTEARVRREVVDFTKEELEIIKYDMEGLLRVVRFQRKIAGNINDPRAIALAKEDMRQNELRQKIVETIDSLTKGGSV